MIPTTEQLEEWLAICEAESGEALIGSLPDVIRELQAERKRNLTLRKRIHCAESHNQYFERCESRWCNPAPPLACGGYEIHDPADEAHGDKFYVAVRAEADRLTTAGLIERDDLKSLTIKQQGEIDRLNLKIWQSETRAKELAKALEFYGDSENWIGETLTGLDDNLARLDGSIVAAVAGPQGMKANYAIADKIESRVQSLRES